MLDRDGDNFTSPSREMLASLECVEVAEIFQKSRVAGNWRTK